MNQPYGAGRDKDYPDHSEYLWHLTGRTKPLVGFRDPKKDALLAPSGTLSGGRERLISILTQPDGPTIWASYLHYMTPEWQKQPAPVCVCFTECIPNSLLTHAGRYSRWGLLFKKSTAYGYGARPVWYVDPAIMNCFAHSNNAWQREHKDPLPFPPDLLHLLMPFAPEYGKYRFGKNKDMPLDWMIEREWRVGGDFEFRLRSIAAVIVPTIGDIDVIRENVLGLEQGKFIVAEDLENVVLEHRDFDAFFRL